MPWQNKLSFLCSRVCTLNRSPVECSVWIKPRTRVFWNAAKSGVFGEELWTENLRMSRSTFVMLCSEVQPYLIKNVMIKNVTRF